MTELFKVRTRALELWARVEPRVYESGAARVTLSSQLRYWPK
jgi:hypothetical protein